MGEWYGWFTQTTVHDAGWPHDVQESGERCRKRRLHHVQARLSNFNDWLVSSVLHELIPWTRLPCSSSPCRALAQSCFMPDDAKHGPRTTNLWRIGSPSRIDLLFTYLAMQNASRHRGPLVATSPLLRSSLRGS